MRNMYGEIWKDIPGYSNYQLSNLGRVRNIKRGTILKVETTKKGNGTYYRVRLASLCKSKDVHFMLHRLLYEVFVGPIPDGKEIDHIDRNPANNDLSNLRLASRSQNNTNSKIQNKHGYKGIGKWGKEDKWSANIKGIGIAREWLGPFYTKEKAALAYNLRARELFGEFACLNEFLISEEEIYALEKKAENTFLNSPKKKGGNLSNKYKGISHCVSGFRLRLNINGREKFIGIYSSAEDALRAKEEFLCQVGYQ